MSLKEKLTADMKEAMKAREEGRQRLGVIRLVRGDRKSTRLNSSHGS